jgi:hypothetical protein
MLRFAAEGQAKIGLHTLKIIRACMLILVACTLNRFGPISFDHLDYEQAVIKKPFPF